MGLQKAKMFIYSKEALNERQPVYWEKRFENYAVDNVLISRVYKNSRDNKTVQVRNGQRTWIWIDIFQSM